MKVYASRQLPTYQLIGDIVRVHWNGEHNVKEGQDTWSYNELVLPKTATPEEALFNGLPPDLAAGFVPSNFVEETNV